MKLSGDANLSMARDIAKVVICGVTSKRREARAVGSAVWIGITKQFVGRMGSGAAFNHRDRDRDKVGWLLVSMHDGAVVMD